MTMATAITLKVVFSLLIAMNVFGNTLVILAVLLNRTMQTPMNYLLTNLALADLSFGIFFIPLKLLTQQYTHPGGWVGDFLCKMFTYGNLSWLSSVASIMTLTFIAWERYHAILHPYSARGRMSKGSVRKMIIGTWVFSVIFLLPETWVLRFDEKEQSCLYDYPDWLNKLDAILWLVVVSILPLGIISFCYGRIVRRLWFSRVTAANVSQRALLQSRKQVTRTVLIVTVVLGCCWLPNLIYVFLDNFSLITDSEMIASDPGPSQPLFYVISHVFIVTNTTVNPIIYATQERKFRRHMWRLVTKRCRRTNQIGEISTPCPSVPGPGEEIVLRGTDAKKQLNFASV